VEIGHNVANCPASASTDESVSSYFGWMGAMPAGATGGAQVARISSMSTPSLRSAGASHAWRSERASPRTPDVDPTNLQRDLASEARWATLFGAFGGAVGAAVMLVTTQAVLNFEHSALDVDALTGVAVQRLLPTIATRDDLVGVAVAIILGAFFGGLLGRLTWRPTRALPRIVFLSILLPAVWLFTQAFVIGRLSRAGAAVVPWVPFMLGTLAYALCVAVAASLRPRRTRPGAGY
jgi:hypothetical protein